MTRAVLFDVDFTLIYPGPTFQGEGYQQFCGRHGLEVDPSRFEAAVSAASVMLDETVDYSHDTGLFLDYIEHIIRDMGGTGPGLGPCAEEIYREWAVNHHFSLYEDVAPTFAALSARGLRLGLVSNTHRCLASFQSHFDLDSFISAAISSSEHGYMKPHPSIFRTALRLLGVEAADAMMVGDNLRQDIEGAVGVGMRAVLVSRHASGTQAAIEVASPAGAVPVPVITTLSALPELLSRQQPVESRQ